MQNKQKAVFYIIVPSVVPALIFDIEFVERVIIFFITTIVLGNILTLFRYKDVKRWIHWVYNIISIVIIIVLLVPILISIDEYMKSTEDEYLICAVASIFYLGATVWYKEMLHEIDKKMKKQINSRKIYLLFQHLKVTEK